MKILISGAVWGISLVSSALAAASYQVVELVGPGDRPLSMNALNNSGSVVGGGSWAPDYDTRAAVWRDGTVGTLPTLSGTWSAAYGINDVGQSVGVSALAGDASHHAVLWSDGRATDLGALPGGASSVAAAINAKGDVVGWSDVPESTWSHATLWSGGMATDLGTAGGWWSIARAINDVGQIAGTVHVGDQGIRAVVWYGGGITILGTLGGPASEAYGINDRGQVAGYAGTGEPSVYHPAIWTDGVVTDLGTFGGTYGVAYDMNDAGQAVGSAMTALDEPRGFLYSDGVTVDLTALLPTTSGWTVTAAVAINDSGLILGYGVAPDGQGATLLLVPTVPEPEIGVGLVLWFGRHGISRQKR